MLFRIGVLIVNYELENLLHEYKEACNMPTKPQNMKTVPKYHIEDENKSVKWNREFAENHNKMYLAKVSEIQRERSLAMNRVQKEIEKYIMKSAKVGEKAARKIFEFAYQEGHSAGLYDVANWIEKLVDLFCDCKEE